MGGKDSKPKEAAGSPPAEPTLPATPAPTPASPKKESPKPAPAAKAEEIRKGPIGDPSSMKLVVPANDPAALKCLIAASVGGVPIYQVLGTKFSAEIENGTAVNASGALRYGTSVTTLRRRSTTLEPLAKRVTSSKFSFTDFSTQNPKPNSSRRRWLVLLRSVPHVR
tara:strand:+ start:7641 stop:8141 length:501 start_codon:yes stop_codon:yes gene_type:complete